MKGSHWNSCCIKWLRVVLVSGMFVSVEFEASFFVGLVEIVLGLVFRVNVLNGFFYFFVKFLFFFSF